MQIIILDQKIKAGSLRDFSKHWYGSLLKGAVDVVNDKVALGGEWHMESSEILSNVGGKKNSIWGFNVVFGEQDNLNKFEYHSLVNIKPDLGHKKMEVTDAALLDKINKVLEKYISLYE